MTTIFRTISLEIGRALLKLAVDRVLRKELPYIFAKLDVQLPFMLINQAKPPEVKAVIADIIEEKTLRKATATQINAVLSLYDPVKAAVRNVINR
jgi:hypothetical protein